MAGVLVVTVAGAALVARSRERRWAVNLSGTPHLTERLAMRLPRGWRVDETMAGQEPVVVTATQQAAGEGELRVLKVVQFTTVTDDPAALLAEYLANELGEPGAATPFSFLGRPGVRVPFLAQLRDPMVPQFVIDERPEWYAATVLPAAGEGGRGLGVILHLGGDAAGGPSAPAVLRKVADGLAVRGSPVARADAVER